MSVFKSVKKNWKQTVAAWQCKEENVNAILTKTKFAPLLHECLKATDMNKIIQNGFRRCGLFPFDVNNIDFSKCVQNVREALQTQNVEDEEDDINFENDINKLLELLDGIRPELSTFNIDVGIVKRELKKKFCKEPANSISKYCTFISLLFIYFL